MPATTPAIPLIRLTAPEKNRKQNYSFTGDPQTMLKLEAISRRTGIARSDLIRRAIDFFLEHVDRSLGV